MIAATVMGVALPPLSAHADTTPSATANSTIKHDDEVLQGPFSDYGEFDSSEDEAADEKFFQFGRFFGIGIGTGFTTATGDAGKIYQGGFPTVDLRLAYWFDFQFALQLSVQNSSHNYDISPDGLTNTNLFRTLVAIKYYFDTKDLSAPITFIGPHLIAGFGYYQRTDNVGSGSNNALDQTTVSSSAAGFNAGLGFELTMKPKKTYLQIETLGHFINFPDGNDGHFSGVKIATRNGIWLSTTVSLMFTW